MRNSSYGLVAGLSLCVALLGCGGSGSPSPTVASIVPADTSLTLAPHESVALAASALDANGHAIGSASIAWSSSDTAVATVTTGGTLAARAVGTAQLVARADAESATVHLRVTSSFSGVAPAEQAACARRVAGAVWCWGGPWSASGQALGVATTYAGLAGGGDPVGTPTFCGVTGAHALQCWGENSVAAPLLGRGVDTAFVSAIPVAVAGGHAFGTVALGFRHACALTTAGRAWCWGGSSYGELGADSTTGSYVADAPDSVLTNDAYSQIGAGAFFSCGLTTGGAVDCWGSANLGRLGDGDLGTDRWRPVPATASATFVQLTVGSSHACALTADHHAYCWGDDAHGELGVGAITSWGVSSPTLVPGDLAFTALAAGDAVTCGLVAGGQAYCWGEADRLGAGSVSVDQTSPVAVAGGHAFASLWAHGAETCGVTSGGAAYCWGSVAGGTLGDGITTHSTIPVRVIDP